MSPQTTHIIRVSCHKHKDMYVATSETLHGLFMFNTSYDTLRAILPESIALLYKANGEDVVVEPIIPDNDAILPVSELNYYARKKAA